MRDQLDEVVTINLDGFDVLINRLDMSHIEGRSWRVVQPRPTYKRYVVWGTRSKGKKLHIRLHRLITNAKTCDRVDHINGNTLDKRRCNLRIVDATKNAWNSVNKKNSRSRFKGVGWSGGRWQVSIRDGNKQHYIGRFKDEAEAAYAYDLASLKYHGEYGLRNFLPLVSE